MRMTRRATLTSLCAMAAGASVPSFAAKTARLALGKVRPIGVQLFMLSKPLDTDFQGTLNQIAKIGYREVEFANFHNRSDTELRQALEEAGLTCPSVHMMLDPMVPGTPSLSSPATIETLLAIGAKHAVVPTFPLSKINLADVGGDQMKLGAAIWKVGQEMTADDWKAFADRLNETGRALAKSGLHIGYHNHNMEFAPLPDGRIPLDLLLQETDPAIVSFELDAGWAAAAGIDPAAFLTKHASRINQVHLKDTAERSGTGFKFIPADVGTGIVDWASLLHAVRIANIEHVYVEQEEPFHVPAIEEARIAFNFLSKRPEMLAH